MMQGKRKSFNRRGVRTVSVFILIVLSPGVILDTRQGRGVPLCSWGFSLDLKELYTKYKMPLKEGRKGNSMNNHTRYGLLVGVQILLMVWLKKMASVPKILG